MQTLLVRHGSCASCGPLLAGRQPGIELDAEGERQAAALARALGGTALTCVYSSPLARAVQTAQPIAAAHGLEPVLRAALLEQEYGEWTGRTFEELGRDPRWDSYNRARSITAPPGGESPQALQARVVAELLSLREQHGDETIVLVTHAEVIRTLVAWCLGMPLDLSLRLEVSPGSLTLVQWYPDYVTVLGVNSTAESR